MKVLFKFVGILNLLFITCSCSESDNAADQQTSQDSLIENNAVDVNDSELLPFSKITRAPKNVYEFDSVRIESYNFENLEPFLHQEDDYTYIINFWATWCVPCVKELPYFEQLRENYLDKNVHVLLVSIDFSKAVETGLVPFLKREKLKSEVVLLDDADANSWIPKVDENWSGAIPATIIYNQSKRAFFEKSFTYEELESELMKIMN